MLFRFIAPQKKNNKKTTKKQQTNKNTPQYVLNTTIHKQGLGLWLGLGLG